MCCGAYPCAPLLSHIHLHLHLLLLPGGRHLYCVVYRVYSDSDSNSSTSRLYITLIYYSYISLYTSPHPEIHPIHPTYSTTLLHPSSTCYITFIYYSYITLIYYSCISLLYITLLYCSYVLLLYITLIYYSYILLLHITLILLLYTILILLSYITELIFGATSGRVKFLSTVQIFRKQLTLLCNLPKARVSALVHIIFGA